MEQIGCEFKVKALAEHPDKNGNDPEATRRFKELLIAKETLTDEVERKNYDCWLNSGLLVNWEDWKRKYTVGKKTPVFHWAMSKGPNEGKMIGDSNEGVKIGVRKEGLGEFRRDGSEMLDRFRSYAI